MRPEEITGPSDLRRLSTAQLVGLAGDIREFLLDRIPATGGHLASNLGVVELAIALHTTFRSPEDRLLWDVGHQGYVHKILTGRASRFGTLRQTGGLSGFLDRDESEHDPFGGSHAGTSLSAAAGLLEAERRTGRQGHVVAVIGDGALTAGMAWEALSNLGGKGGPLLVVLNDNGMSISPNVGMVHAFLTRLRSAPLYRAALRGADRFLGRHRAGRWLRDLLSNAKDSVRNFFFRPGAPFEAFGFRYFGPVDGHDLPGLLAILGRLKGIHDRPVLLHAVTKKGKGDAPSEADPVRRHGVGGPGPAPPRRLYRAVRRRSAAGTATCPPRLRPGGAAERAGDRSVELLDLRILSDGEEVVWLGPRDAVRLEISLRLSRPISQLIVEANLRGAGGDALVSVNSGRSDVSFDAAPGEHL
ncbi:hypothetical protein IIA16_05440, partial [bacterium]|nr:hypothetical protein [bacterium]